MASRWLTRVAIATAVAGALTIFSTSAAWADTPIDIGNGHVGNTASDYEVDCGDVQGAPFPGEDIWVFNLPGNDRDFVSVTAHFDTDGVGGEDLVVTIPTNGGAIFTHGNGTSQAWIDVPAGSILTGATAIVTGDPPPPSGPGSNVFFVVTHACPGTTTTTTPPTTGPPTTGPPTSTQPPVTTTVPGTSPSDPGDDDLPVTGVALSGIVTAGLALIVGGAALLIARRRRDHENPAEL